MKVIDATRPDSVTVQERGAFRVIPVPKQRRSGSSSLRRPHRCRTTTCRAFGGRR